MNIRSVQQVMQPSQIHWVPTQLMVADGLTKHDPKLQNQLRIWCDGPLVQLRENPTKTKTSEKHSVLVTDATARLESLADA